MFCVMHLYNNFKQAFKGLGLKSMLWKATRSTRIIDFEAAMKELKVKDKEAFKWLAKRPAKGWSRSYFRTHSKCDILLNNMCESFNSSILQARKRPIVDMLEQIMLILMKRIYVKRDLAKKWKGALCPNADKLLEEGIVRIMGHNARRNREVEYEIQTAVGIFMVNMERRNCTCRKWQLNMIPCSLAICAMFFMGYKPIDYVDPCYLKTTYMQTYENCMHILHGPEEWPQSNKPGYLPPIPEQLPGRPRDSGSKEEKESS